MSIFERAGSRGNSTICLPRGVSVPVLSSAPRIHSWYIEFKILSWVGGEGERWNRRRKREKGEGGRVEVRKKGEERERREGEMRDEI